MITLDRMDLADCFTPEDLVQEIFKQCPTLTPPIPVIDIAKATGIKKVVGMKLGSLGGMLVSDDAKNEGIILHHTEGPPGRKRFTIGHELGHFLLPKHGAEQHCYASNIKSGNNAPNKGIHEAEANHFSQLLLMPERFVSPAINTSIPDINILRAISYDFDMSFEAMSNRCVQLCKYPIALVYSHRGAVRYCRRNKDIFKHRIPLEEGDLLPSTSQTANLQQSANSISKIKQVNASIWLGAEHDELILEEQTYIQDKGYRVTLLRLHIRSN